MARTCKVAAGDTLAKLAGRFYGDSTLFPLIAARERHRQRGLITVGSCSRFPRRPCTGRRIAPAAK